MGWEVIMAKFVVLTMLLVVLPFQSYSAEKLKTIKRVDSMLAVFDFDVQGDIDKSIARSLAESVRIEIVNSGKYEVIDRSNMNKILKEQAFQMTGCVAKECAVEAGQMLGVGKIVVGTVGLIGKTYYLTLALVNVETGKTEIVKDEECKCEVDALIATSKRVAKGLMGQAPQPEATIAVNKISSSPTITEDTYIDPLTWMEFVFIKGGCFLMGNSNNDGRDRERPVHEVCVDDFYIGKFEVTQNQWKIVMGNNPSAHVGGQYPVENVSWEEAQVFCLKLKQKTGMNYRLPTEAEWEYAARARGKDEKWAGTNNEQELWDYAWYKKQRFSDENHTHAVGLKKPNSIGLHDMSGNVKEWVYDIYDEKYYDRNVRDNPRGPTAGDGRVARGGSFDDGSDNVRVYRRDNNGQTRHMDDCGFRMDLQIKSLLSG
jgi:sulfatase modifying factor 1